MKMRHWVGSLVLMSLLVTVAGPLASKADSERSVEQMIAEAKTAADYAAIAEYYEHAAQSAREDLHRYERERSSAAK